jgi:hypothetical protein
MNGGRQHETPHFFAQKCYYNNTRHYIYQSMKIKYSYILNFKKGETNEKIYLHHYDYVAGSEWVHISGWIEVG